MDVPRDSSLRKSTAPLPEGVPRPLVGATQLNKTPPLASAAAAATETIALPLIGTIGAIEAIGTRADGAEATEAKGATAAERPQPVDTRGEIAARRPPRRTPGSRSAERSRCPGGSPCWSW